MSALADFYVKKEKLAEILEVMKIKNIDGIAFTISLSHEPSEYNSNVRVYVAQTKEQRDEKKPQFTIGYGKVFWMDSHGVKVIGKKQITAAESISGSAQMEADDLIGTPDSDLPF